MIKSDHVLQALIFGCFFRLQVLVLFFFFFFFFFFLFFVDFLRVSMMLDLNNTVSVIWFMFRCLSRISAII